MSYADDLRDNAREWDISECPQRAEIARRAADRIEDLEAGREVERQMIRNAADRIEELEAENDRLRVAMAMTPPMRRAFEATP